MIHGIVTPLVTPLSDREQLDEEGLERLLEQQLDANINGVFILGTTGEGPSLSDRLQRAMIRKTSQLVDQRIPFYVGITDTCLARAIELARYSADLGAAAVVAAPPFYFPAGQTELKSWFVELADSLPLPLILYNMPGCAKIAIAPATLQSLIRHDNIVGMKDSSGDIEYFAKALDVASTRANWPVLIGPEAMLVEAMKLGASGGVTGGANLFPQLFTQLLAAIDRGDETEIEGRHKSVVQLQSLYGFGKYGSSYLKGLKCALELRGICSGMLAAPFDAFKEPERLQVQNWLSGFAECRLPTETATQQ